MWHSNICRCEKMQKRGEPPSVMALLGGLGIDYYNICSQVLGRADCPYSTGLNVS